MPSTEDEKFAIFVHEYWHYLQNTTTPAGFDSFRLTQGLLWLFSQTMDPSANGVSLGSPTLRDEHKELTTKTAQRRALLQGKPGPEGRLGSDEITGRVLAVQADGTITVEIEKHGHRIPGSQQFRLGSHAIDESIAHLVEGIVRRTIGIHEERTPEFPYRVLERVVAYFCGSETEPPAVVAGLGTLLLMTDGPGHYLHRIVGAYAKHRSNGLEPFVALRAVAVSELPSIKTHVQRVGEIVDEIDKMHLRRGTSERAIAYLCAQYRRSFARRVTDPLFDIAPLLVDTLDQTALLNHFKSLYKEFPPCDFVIEEPDESGAAVRTLVSAQPADLDEKGLDISQYLRSFQAQQEFMLAHLRSDGFCPSASVRLKCPYFETCEHPLRSADMEVCKSAPWEHTRRDAPGCWFTNGVWATLGEGDFRRVSAETDRWWSPFVTRLVPFLRRLANSLPARVAARLGIKWPKQ